MQFTSKLTTQGFDLYKAALDRAEQEALRDAIRDVAAIAPLVRPVMPSGKPMTVRMSAAGRLGWITDRSGYRYSPVHPDGPAWPAIPAQVLDIWSVVTGLERQPDCCLINYYATDARMGLHQDRDEGDFQWPVVSISLGDTATFRMGGSAPADPTRSVRLESGDIVVMGGAARLAYHGVDRIHAGTSTLLNRGGRINLTLRVVDLRD